MPVSRQRKKLKEKSHKRTQMIDQTRRTYEKLMKEAMEKQIEELRKKFDEESSGVTFGNGNSDNNI